MSDVYNATYQVMQNKIHNGDIGEAVQRAIEGAGLSFMMSQLHDAFRQAVYEYERPSIMLKPRLFREGNLWGCIHGGNPMEGVEGYGESPDLAYRDFDKNWNKKIEGLR